MIIDLLGKSIVDEESIISFLIYLLFSFIRNFVPDLNNARIAVKELLGLLEHSYQYAELEIIRNSSCQVYIDNKEIFLGIMKDVWDADLLSDCFRLNEELEKVVSSQLYEIGFTKSYLLLVAVLEQHVDLYKINTYWITSLINMSILDYDTCATI